MSRQFRIDRLANQDLRAAYRWYEDQRQGLGEEFADDAAKTFERIRDFADSFEIIEQDVRIVVFSRFPYVALYRGDDEEIVVLAGYHQRRDPELWARRLPN